jgi:hypothetical protein
MARQPVAMPSRDVEFYAYVLGGFLNVQWHIDTMQQPTLMRVVKDFLSHIYGKEEHKKLGVLNAIRDKSRNQIKDVAKYKLPSLFVGRAAWPLAQPKEAPNAKFDIEFIYRLKHTVDELKEKETAMEEQQKTQTQTSPQAPRFHLPAGVTPEQLTIENFRTLTGRRFRVTTEQQNRIAAGTLTRDAAFAEFVAELKNEPRTA